MTDNERLEQVANDPQYQQHCAEIVRLNKERYDYCTILVNQIWMQGEAAVDSADQPRVDEIDHRIEKVCCLIEEIYANHGTAPAPRRTRQGYQQRQYKRREY